MAVVGPSRGASGASRRPVGRAFALVLTVLAVLLSTAVPAAAHTEVTRSDPPNGGMVPEGATSLRLWFDEPVGAAASTFSLRTEDGRELPITVDLTTGESTAEVRPDQPLARGTYVLDWHVLSLTDGHSSSGTVVFGAGLRPASIAAFGNGLPSTELLVLRWVSAVSLLLAIGALAVSGRVLGAAGTRSTALRRRVLRIGAAAAWCAVYAGIMDPLLRTRGAGSSTSAWAAQVRMLLWETSWGRGWVAREVALVVAATALTLLQRRGGVRRRAAQVAAAGLTAAAALQSWAGHAALLPAGGPLTAVMDTAHMVAAGVWVGGLAVLVAAVTGRRGRPDGDAGSGAMWRTYSPRAAVATVVLLGTGLYQAGHYVPSTSAAADTTYGLGVLAKVGLLLAGLVLAALNSARVGAAIVDRPSRAVGDALRRLSGRWPLRTGLLLEVTVVGAAVLAAGLVASVPTTREVAEATRPSSPRASSVDGLFVTVESLPEAGDHRRLIVRARSTVRPEPAPIQVVTAELSGPGGRQESVTLESIEPERFEGLTPALAPGEWQATFELNRTGQVPSEVSGSWTVAEPGTAPATAFQRGAQLAGLLILGALAAAAIRFRRRSTPHLVRVDEPAAALEESRR